jgi:phage terminase large subunit GpA-like protein
MSAKATASPGRYNPNITPWVFGMHEALDDPRVQKVVCMKSAQVAWTDGVLLNYIGRRIDDERGIAGQQCERSYDALISDAQSDRPQ